MDHLHTSHVLNRHVTTFTYETKLVPDADEVYITPTMLQAVRRGIADKTEIKDGFKNCFIVTLHVPSPREGAKIRRVSTKVFNNLRLHVTGTHSLEMVQHVVDVIKEWLSEFTGVAIKEDMTARRVDVALYKYQLPGEVNLMRLQDVLTQRNILSIYDPNNYAGVRSKFPVDNDKDASIMIFRKGKVIIIIPRQPSFDKTLKHLLDQIESIMKKEWENIAVKTVIHPRRLDEESSVPLRRKRSRKPSGSNRKKRRV